MSLLALLALVPIATSAAPRTVEEPPVLVRLFEWIQRLVGAEEGGPDIDPLGLAEDQEPETKATLRPDPEEIDAPGVR